MSARGNVLRLVIGWCIVCTACTACVATVRPAPGPRAEVVYAVREPPPPRVEIIAAAPDDEHVWLSGHWAWRAERNDYEWQPGRWQRLEVDIARGCRATGCKSRADGGDIEGRFEPVVYVARQPPPPREREDVVVARPGPEHVWIKGYWDYRNGDFDWVAGHWARPEPGFHAWVEPRWQHEARGWFLVEGHWKV